MIPKNYELLIPEDNIKEKVKQLGEEISKDYQGKCPIFIGVLNGAFIFMSDLLREITVDCEVDFIKLSSYGDAKISSGKVTVLKDFDCQVEGRDIIVVEDIVDSGLSVKYMRDKLLKMNPKSLKFTALLLKPECVKIDFSIDYIGFSIPNKFVIGYGMDHSQKDRNLKSIYVVV